MGFKIKYGWADMALRNRVAFLNLSLLGLCLIFYRIITPDGVYLPGRESVGAFLYAVTAVLSFPVGWLSLLAAPTPLCYLLAAIFVPFNAYLWGFIIESLVETFVWRKRKIGTDSQIIKKDTLSSPMQKTSWLDLHAGFVFLALVLFSVTIWSCINIILYLKYEAWL